MAGVNYLVAISNVRLNEKREEKSMMNKIGKNTREKEFGRTYPIE
jgi:hypothetical protein